MPPARADNNLVLNDILFTLQDIRELLKKLVDSSHVDLCDIEQGIADLRSDLHH